MFQHALAGVSGPVDVVSLCLKLGGIQGRDVWHVFNYVCV